MIVAYTIRDELGLDFESIRPEPRYAIMRWLNRRHSLPFYQLAAFNDDKLNHLFQGFGGGKARVVTMNINEVRE